MIDKFLVSGRLEGDLLFVDGWHMAVAFSKEQLNSGGNG